ncbi:MAG: DUF1611 domain-containing protein [Candidatus Methylomirabilales bacterium]
MGRKRVIILTEGKSNPHDAKTATGVIRYRAEEVVAVLDSTQKGRTAGEVFGVGGSIPFIGKLGELEADTLLIGIAPAGGGLPPEWRPVLREAIERRMELVSGLHYFLGDDPELGPLARARGASILDVRRPPPDVTVSANLAKDLPCFRVHTVGNDCNVGKMLTSIEVARGLQARGKRAEFVATGQTGIMISGWGMPIDRVVSDFVAGAIERLMIERRDAEYLLIEGQGSLIHPLFSGVTLGLLHGCAPQAMILCYEAGRAEVRHANMAMPPLAEVLRIYETMASVIRPSRVIGIAVNTRALSPADADKEVNSAEDRHGLPATDVIRFGAEKLVAATLAERERSGDRGRGRR